MKWLKLLCKQGFCKHEWDLNSKEYICTGVTLSWGLIPERQWTITKWCKKCNKKRIEKGMLCEWHKCFHPKLYDEYGWPIDEKGNRLKLGGHIMEVTILLKKPKNM